MNRKPWVPIGIVLVVAALIYMGPPKIGPIPIPFVPGKPLDFVVAIYDAETQTEAEADVLNGVTATSVKKAGKWRAYDKDHIPDYCSAAIQKKFDTGLKPPCLVLSRDKELIYAAPMPETDEALASTLKRNGGF